VESMADGTGDVPGQSKYARLARNLIQTYDGLTYLSQGYELSDDEVKISLEDFRAQYMTNSANL